MRKLLYCSLIFTLLGIVGCSKEKDEDACNGKTCKNGSTCVDGVCDCPPNYTGSDCGTQITPSQISIERIEVKQWPPLTPNGNNWDEGWCIGSYPDIFVTLNDGSGQIVKTSFISECREDTVYNYTDSLPVVTANVNNNLMLSLYDNDTGFCFPSDSMGTVSTQIYHPDNDFPPTLELADPAKEIEVTIYIEYIF